MTRARRELLTSRAPRNAHLEPTIEVRYDVDDLDVREWAQQYVRQLLAFTGVPVHPNHPQ